MLLLQITQWSNLILGYVTRFRPTRAKQFQSIHVWFTKTQMRNAINYIESKSIPKLVISFPEWRYVEKIALKITHNSRKKLTFLKNWESLSTIILNQSEYAQHFLLFPFFYVYQILNKDNTEIPSKAGKICWNTGQGILLKNPGSPVKTGHLGALSIYVHGIPFDTPPVRWYTRWSYDCIKQNYV